MGTAILATFTSTRPESSSSVDLKVMLVLLDVRSSSIPMVDGAPTEEVHSPERTLQRSIDLPPTPAVGWPSPSSRLVSASAHSYSFLTLLVSRNLWVSSSRRTEPKRKVLQQHKLPKLSRSTSIAVLAPLLVTSICVNQNTTRLPHTAISVVSPSRRTE